MDWVRSGLALKMGDAGRAEELLRGSVAGFAAEGDRYGQAIASIRLGELAELRGDYDEAVALTTFAYEGTMSTGPGANASILATRLGNLAANQGALRRRRQRGTRRRCRGPGSWAFRARPRRRSAGWRWPPACRAASTRPSGSTARRWPPTRRSGSVEGVAFTHACLGFLATKRGDAEEALELHRRSLAKAALGSERRAMALAVEGLAGAHAGVRGRRRRGAVAGVAAELRGERIVSPPWLLAERTRVEAATRSLLGDAPLRRRSTGPVASRPRPSSPASSPTLNSSSAEPMRDRGAAVAATGSVADDVGDEDVGGELAEVL